MEGRKNLSPLEERSVTREDGRIIEVYPRKVGQFLTILWPRTHIQKDMWRQKQSPPELALEELGRTSPWVVK